MIVTQKPVKGSGVIRDFLLSEGIPTARLRRKELFTPYQQRMRIMSENLDKPEEFRTRSLRRKLTKLDRALSDDGAYALDRAFSAWLILNGKSKSVDASEIHGDSIHLEPLNQRELEQGAAFSRMGKKLPKQWLNAMERLFAGMAPWNDTIYKIEISEIVAVAKRIKIAYEQK